MAGRGKVDPDELTFLEEEIATLEKRLASMDHDEMAREVPYPDTYSDYERHTEQDVFHAPELRMPRDAYFTPEPNAYLPRERYVTFRKQRPVTSTPREVNPSKVDPTNKTEPDMPVSSDKPRGVKIKAATYDGSSSWIDYKAHFQVCAELNKWTDKEKGQYLAVSLRGHAQGVFGNLGAKCCDFNELSKALEDRFSPANQTELYRVQLRERRQKPSDTLPELAQDIRRLTNQAYATAPADVRETLAKEQFIDALKISDMRIRIKQARPKNLNDAVQHAVELEAYIKAERQHQEGQGFLAQTALEVESPVPTEVSKIQKDVTSLQETITNLSNKLDAMISKQKKAAKKKQGSSQSKKDAGKSSDNKKKSKRRCYLCGSEHHIKPDCPDLKKNTNQNETLKVTEQSKNVSAIGAGLYITCKLNNVPVDCLIDTGASLTIISCRTADFIKGSGDLSLKPFNRKLCTASGDQIGVKGKTDVLIEIGAVKSVTSVVVADIEGDMILGLDFMTKNNCHIDLVHNTINIQGSRCQLRTEGDIGCYRVTVAESVNIPAKTEVIIPGKTNAPFTKGDALGIIEPLDGEMKFEGLIGKALINLRDTVPIRLMNIGDETEVLKKGTYIANISAVKKVVESCSVNKSSVIEVPQHLQDLYQRTIQGLTTEQQEQVAKLLLKHAHTFSQSDEDIGRTGIIRHKISTGDAHPIKQPLRKIPERMNEEVNKHVDDMLAKDVIEPSSSPWASGIVLVQKKDGTTRFCVDYRRLNDVTIKDAYPLPRIDQTLDQLSGSQWFSCLDLHSGYWQVEMEEEDKSKTAFTCRKGLFQFKVMPFGLCNAPATFERLMETVLAGLNWDICLIYLDDIIVTGKSFDEMVHNLDKVLSKLHEAGLKLKAKKCHLFADKVEYLGHIISRDGVQTDPKKTEVVRNWPIPESVKDVRSFVGFCSYYRRFVPNFAQIAKPLHRLCQKDTKFVWNEACQTAFETLKEKMVEAPILGHPDFSKPYILDTDASDFAVGGVLSQIADDGKERVIAYASRTLTKSEKNYCVTRRELLALVHFVRYFRNYLYGRKFKVRTDHGSLRWLMRAKEPEGQKARWLEMLSSFEMEVEHRAGRSHKNADGLSRIPCPQCGLDNQGDNVCFQISQGQKSEGLNMDELQEQDHDIGKVRKWVVSGKRPELDTIESQSRLVKSLWHQWPNLKITEGLLTRCWSNEQTSQQQVIVPLKERKAVLKHMHDNKSSGHLGVRKTTSRILQRYYWPGLRADVRTYIGGCEKCSKRKGPTKAKAAPMQITRSGYPMERVAIDILGELPLTDNGNRYILVVADYFTKWTECFPMPNMEAKTVAKLLVNEVIARFGVPDTIHSDQGRQFDGRLFAEMCSLLQIKKTRTTPYHPESDGMVERFNRTLLNMLSTLVEDTQRDWDEQLPYVLMAYRSAEHETTSTTPNMLMLGRETTTPLDLMYEMPPSIKSLPSNEWVWELRDRLERAHTKVRQNTGTSMNRQKKYKDRNISFERFGPGDKVYVYFPVHKVGRSPKLSSFWKGPFSVITKISDVLYKVDCGRANTPQVIHCDRMKKCKTQVLAGEKLEHFPSSDDSLNSPEIQSDCESDTAEYHTEGKADTRIRKKPVWMKDYILSTCRDMAKVKTTPRAKNTNTTCLVCNKKFDRRQYMLKHLRRVHKGYMPDAPPAKLGSVQPSSSTMNIDTQSNSSLDWDSDPDIEIDPDSESEDEETTPEPTVDPAVTLGRIERKPTRPTPVKAPVRHPPARTEQCPIGEVSSDSDPEGNDDKSESKESQDLADTGHTSSDEPENNAPKCSTNDDSACAMVVDANNNRAKGVEILGACQRNPQNTSRLKLVVYEEKDEVMTIGRSFKQGQDGSIKLNLGECIEEQTIKPSQIEVTVNSDQTFMVKIGC